MSPSRDSSRLAAQRPASRSQSRAGSRPRLVSRAASVASGPYLPLGPEQLINSEGAISEGTAELLQDLVHPHHELDATLVDQDAEDTPEDAEDIPDDFRAGWSRLPWWKRPSPWWFLISIPVSSIALAMTLAPRVVLFTYLACHYVRPDYEVGWDPKPSDMMSLMTAMAKNPMISGPSKDDSEWQRCASDPVVQAAVSKLVFAMTASMGVLGCLTTAFWSSLSDRYGRIRIMGISSIGVLVTDANFLLVYFFMEQLPGGPWWLVLGPLFDGFFGGIGSVSSMIHAYITDCTDLHNRAQVFSLFLGLLFAGMSLGPTLGSLLIDRTHDIMSVFYLTTALHLVFCSLLWLFCPESLSPVEMRAARRAHALRRERLRESRRKGALGAWFRTIFAFAAPLTVFRPTVYDASGRKRRDWNLIALVAGSATVMSLVGAVSIKYQYMGNRFHWGAEEIGFWQSGVGAARALHLTVVLPFLIKLLQPKTQPIQLPTSPSEPLHSEPAASDPATSSPNPSTSSADPTSPSDTPADIPTTHHHPQHLPRTDLIVVRCSQLLEISCYIAMGLASSGGPFTAFSVLGAFGSGFGPASSSLASALYAARGGREMGKLFGAMSVLQTLCSQVVGPALFAFTYVATVATVPQAIFFLAAGLIGLSFCIMLFIRLPQAQPDAEGAHLEREATLVEQVLVVVEDADDAGAKVLKP